MDNLFVFENFFELASEAMLITELDGTIIKCNQTTQSLLQQSSSLENTIQSLSKPQDVCLIDEYLAKIRERTAPRKFAIRLDNTNPVVWVEWYVKHDLSTNYLYWTGRNVTDFKRKEAFLEMLEEVTGTGVWELETENNAVHWSRKIHEIHGTDPESYKPVLEGALSFYAEDALPPLLEAIEKQEKTGDSYDLNLPFRTAKNEDIIVNAKSFMQERNGVVLRRYGTFKDITEDLQKALEKQKQTNRMALALECSNLGVWEFDIANETLIWDERMMEIYGLTSEEFKGELADWENAVVSEDFIRAQAEFTQAMETGELFLSEFRIQKPSGEMRHLKAMASNVYDADGKLTHCVGVNLDVSEEVAQLQQLEQAKERSEAADKAKSRFLATMSHEIRTPLNGVIGGLQIIKNLHLPPKEEDIANRSLESAKSLLHIINDILDYTKITENRIELDYIRVDVRALLKQIIDEHEVLLEAARVALHFRYASDTPNFFEVDPIRFRQIVTNLLGNAIKFTPRGNIYVDVSMTDTDTNPQLQLQIVDTGIGMTKEQKAKLFDPFVQADSSTTRKFGGTGLGLSIVDKLTSLMNGTIDVESQPDMGSSFTLTFPFIVCDATETKKEPYASLDVPNLSHIKIIVAEDNELNQILIDAMLQETNAQVTLVENGKRLIEAFATESYDIVLCDINMPVMGGVDACTILRKQDKHTPIFAFTANVMEDDVEHYYSVGFTDIIPKPVIKEDLYSQLAYQSALLTD